MGDIKLQQAPTITMMANGMPLAPRFSAMAMVA
jgi:hypothetical protein